MARINRRSGFSLVLAGLLGLVFFWLTDPRIGMALRWNHGENPIDLANEHLPGTIVGMGRLGPGPFDGDFPSFAAAGLMRKFVLK